MKYYQMTVDQVAQIFGVRVREGLNFEQVEKSFKKYGYNHSQQKTKATFLSLLLDQVKDPLSYFLLASAGVLFFAGNRLDAGIILAILALNIAIGVAQEYRIHSILSRVEKFKSTHSLVIRNKEKIIISDTQLVPGDILILQEGERIPADARLIEAYDFTIDESILTGESTPVIKDSVVLEGGEIPLYEQKNMVFLGSYILSGNAKAIVVATGKWTEGAKIEKIVKRVLPQMPLEKDLGDLLRFILGAIVFICFALLFIGIFTGKPIAELFAALIALFVCVVPQGLPVIMTLVLVSGVYRSAKKNVLVKRLQAVEALGRVQVMIIDKTGTLTRNEFMVDGFFAGTQEYKVTGKGYFPEGQILDLQGNPAQLNEIAQLMLTGAQLLDRSQVEYIPTLKVYTIKGNPSEAAMEICANKAGITDVLVSKEYTELFEIPFSAEYQFHAGFYEKNGKGVVFGLGSPEVIEKRCAQVSQEQKDRVDDLLQRGVRVISVGYREFNIKDIPQESKDKRHFFAHLFDCDLTLLGAFGIQDTLREQAPEIIKTLQDAGIKIIMATGDNKKTAAHLALQSGIVDDKEHPILEGAAMQNLSDEQMMEHLDTISIYARVLPADKLRLVTLFQKKGKTTVMIGDGVNDAPSLVAAELGVAMGNTGSEVAKEAADIILLDDSFASIVTGVTEGRYIFYTFRRVVLYFFVTNFSEILIVLFTMAFGYPIPLLAAQILWLSIVTDSCLDIALSLEEPEDNLLRSSWSLEYSSLITKGLVMQVGYMSLLIAGLCSGVFVWYLPQGLLLARTMTMTIATFCMWATALNCRSFTFSTFSLSPLRNIYLFIALAGVFIGLLLILYVPFLQIVFKTVALGLSEWVVVLAAGGIMILVEEVRKIFARAYPLAH